VKARTIDVWAVTALLVLVAAYMALFFDFGALPDEDAAILLRYADHLARGYGLVWNPGEPPVEGATDFGFTVLVAFLMNLGLSLELAARTAGIVAHFALVALVYVASARLAGVHRGLAFFSAAFVALGPGLNYAQVHFGTPVFALAAAVSFAFSMALYRRVTVRDSVLFSLSCLVMGLIRPEGVLYAGFMLLGLVAARGLRETRAPIVSFIAVFATLGGAYFVWRATYFGHLLPSPVYVKGGGGVYIEPLLVSAKNIGTMTLLFFAVPLLALRTTRSARKAALVLVPVVGFGLIWVFLNDMQNYLMRYQYAALPPLAMWWAALLPDIRRDWGLPRFDSLSTSRRRLAGGVLALAGGGMLFVQLDLYRNYVWYERGLYDVATILGDYRDRGYTLTTTEAGLLPLYSGWRTIDAWGLNDEWIAHNGGITEDYLAANEPHVIMAHAFFSPVSPPATEPNAWDRMALTLRRYAEENGYTLAACFGVRPGDTHYYYVHPDIPESEEITERIRSLEYRWVDRRIANDYAVAAMDQ
jgi:hypothetical protein